MVAISTKSRSETSTVDNGWSNVGLFGVFDGHGGFQVQCHSDLLWWLFCIFSRSPNSVNVAASTCLLEMATLMFHVSPILWCDFLSSAMPDFRSLTWSYRIQAWFEDVKICEVRKVRKDGKLKFFCFLLRGQAPTSSGSQRLWKKKTQTLTSQVASRALLCLKQLGSSEGRRDDAHVSCQVIPCPNLQGAV